MSQTQTSLIPSAVKSRSSTFGAIRCGWMLSVVRTRIRRAVFDRMPTERMALATVLRLTLRPFYESQAAELHGWIEGLSADELDAHPVPGTWSMRELMAHMLDSDLVYGHRMRKVAAERRPLMMGYDERLWAATPALQAGDAQAMATIFELHRRWIASFLRALPPEAWSREGIHSERGVVTIASLLSTMLNHVTHHATFVEAKREKLGKPMKGNAGAVRP